MAVLWWIPHKNQKSCAKILDPDGIPLLRRLRYQEINLVLQAGKDQKEEEGSAWGQGVIVYKIQFSLSTV